MSSNDRGDRDRRDRDRDREHRHHHHHRPSKEYGDDEDYDSDERTRNQDRDRRPSKSRSKINDATEKLNQKAPPALRKENIKSTLTSAADFVRGSVGEIVDSTLGDERGARHYAKMADRGKAGLKEARLRSTSPSAANIGKVDPRHTEEERKRLSATADGKRRTNAAPVIAGAGAGTALATMTPTERERDSRRSKADYDEGYQAGFNAGRAQRMSIHEIPNYNPANPQVAYGTGPPPMFNDYGLPIPVSQSGHGTLYPPTQLTQSMYGASTTQPPASQPIPSEPVYGAPPQPLYQPK